MPLTSKLTISSSGSSRHRPGSLSKSRDRLQLTTIARDRSIVRAGITQSDDASIERCGRNDRRWPSHDCCDSTFSYNRCFRARARWRRQPRIGDGNLHFGSDTGFRWRAVSSACLSPEVSSHNDQWRNPGGNSPHGGRGNPSEMQKRVVAFRTCCHPGSRRLAPANRARNHRK